MNPQYPIGEWQRPNKTTFENIQGWINDITVLPDHINQITQGLTVEELQKTYRDGSWTVRQLIHHLADSHLNAYLRHKLCYTTLSPTINPYNESAWSLLEDVKVVPVSVSKQLLEALHLRWSVFLNSLSESDMQRSFIHPQHNRIILLEESIGMYSWHGRHHLEHIRIALKR